MCILHQTLDDQSTEPPTAGSPLSRREENRIGLPRDLDRQDPPYGEGGMDVEDGETTPPRRDPVVATP
ncbi:hypothetical protein FLW53_13550 [Microbispora sp. SCL1-1]|jgi:hypothetical protein|uniref:hypothetical protein n=1 Tax=Microbispora TaxID=2005 RepID=UPI00115B7596|nr:MULTISPECIES: hypothetical protein [unclassified Microbispora]NJP25215.1 hypothetical protein [Microbispora sp. CL1-1]TQS13672.1 hypothetical protein FLW53_13550 [Microbispora sp. SCL1-1]